MKNKFTWKTTAVTLILAIVGSALWENMFRDLFNFLGRFLLTISTLGIESYKDNIYKSIAKGFNEGVSLQIYFFQQLMFFAFVVSLCYGMFLLRKRTFFKKDYNSKENLSESITKTLVRNPLFVWFLSFYVILVGTITFLDLTKRFYINSSVTYFDQLVKINQPYMTPEENKQYISLFAQISNKADYSILIEKLKEKAIKNKQKVPDFDFIF